MRRRFSRIAFALWAALAAEALGQQQGAAPPTPAQLAERLAQLKSGRELPYRLVANWPTLPKGYNLGEGTGVDVDRQGNVWVANRGAWPIVEFDKAGKMLQAWNHDTVRVTPGVGLGTHGLKVDPEGNPPAGLIIHTAGPTESGWRVVDVWESEETMNAFRDNRLFPAIAASVGQLPSQPKIQVHEVYDLIIP